MEQFMEIISVCDMSIIQNQREYYKFENIEALSSSVVTHGTSSYTKTGSQLLSCLWCSRVQQSYQLCAWTVTQFACLVKSISSLARMIISIIVPRKALKYVCFHCYFSFTSRLQNEVCWSMCLEQRFTGISGDDGDHSAIFDVHSSCDSTCPLANS